MVYNCRVTAPGGSILASIDYSTRPPTLPADLDAAAEPIYRGLSLSAWLKIGIVTVLMSATFWVVLRHLYLKTNPITGDANWGHAILVPLVGLYYLYINRETLLSLNARPLLAGGFTRARLVSSGLFVVVGLGIALLPEAPFIERIPLLSKVVAVSAYVQAFGEALAILGALALLLNWSLGTLLFGLFTFGYGIWPGRNDFVRDFGMVVTLFGVVLTLCGWQIMRIAWFPIAFLICTIPWPGLVYSAIAMPLQNLAATVAVGVLNVCGVEASQFGTKIFMPPDRTLNVEEACAGMRSLMTFISIGGAIAFLSSRPLWQKIVIVLSAIPIAIFCNVMRVTGQGLLDHYWSREVSEGFSHQFVGLIMLLPAFFLLLGVGWVLDQIFVEEVDVAGARRKDESGIIVARRRAAAAVTTANTTASREGVSA